MKSFLSLIAFVLCLQGTAQNKSITFTEKSWKEILETARKENRLIFLDAYASWCGPCKWMAKNVFTNDAVAEYYNQHFINAKIDMEKGEGPELAKKYQVSAYPTLLYINHQGEVVHRTCGSSGADEFIETGKIANDPEKQYLSYQKRYQDGNREAEFLKKYLHLTSESCLPTDLIVAEYFNDKEPEEMSSMDNWQIIFHYLEDARSEAFGKFVQNREIFEGKFGADSIHQKLDITLGRFLRKTAWESNRDNNPELFREARDYVSDLAWEGSATSILIADLYHLSLTKNHENYVKTAMEGVREHLWDNPGQLNNIAWEIFENSSDESVLNEAATWAERSVELQPGAANMDTWAALLFKSGRVGEAAEIQQQAVEMAARDGEDVQAYEETLKKYQAANK